MAVQFNPVIQYLSRLAGAAVEFAVPAGCILCNRRTDRPGLLCPSCWSTVHFVDRPYCEILGQPFAHEQGPGAVSPQAIADPPPFARLRCAVVYDGPARRLVSDLKFTDRTELAPWMAGWMRMAGRELTAECRVVVPVPLHRLRLFRRRYNQSAELARAIARDSGLVYLPRALARIRHTRRQVGLTAAERTRNVQGAFRVPPEWRPAIEGRRVLLVDDVYTSGATAKSCSRALLRAGADAVDVLVFASVLDGNI